MSMTDRNHLFQPSYSKGQHKVWHLGTEPTDIENEHRYRKENAALSKDVR